MVVKSYTVVLLTVVKQINKQVTSANILLSFTEFSLGSFCSVVDVMNFSKLRVLRLDGNEISLRDVPTDSALCLRMASEIAL